MVTLLQDAKCFDEDDSVFYKANKVAPSRVSKEAEGSNTAILQTKLTRLFPVDFSSKRLLIGFFVVYYKIRQETAFHEVFLLKRQKNKVTLVRGKTRKRKEAMLP